MLSRLQVNKNVVIFDGSGVVRERIDSIFASFLAFKIATITFLNLRIYLVYHLTIFIGSFMDSLLNAHLTGVGNSEAAVCIWTSFGSFIPYII